MKMCSVFKKDLHYGFFFIVLQHVLFQSTGENMVWLIILGILAYGKAKADYSPQFNGRRKYNIYSIQKSFG